MGGLGSKALARYHETRTPLGKTAAIKAKCADCMSDYVDGRVGCEITDCVLYPYMPYSDENPAKRRLNPRRR